MGWSLCGGGSAEFPSNYWSGTQSQYDALSTHSDDTWYNVTDTLGVHTTAIYVGDTLIYSRELDYDYYIEDVQMSGLGSAIDTGITLFSTANINRNFQIDFKINLNGNPSEQAFFGDLNDQANGTSLLVYNSGNSGRIYSKPLINDSSVNSNLDNKDVNVIKNDGNLIIVVDGSVVYATAFAPTNSNNNSVLIGRWETRLPIINGYIDYFGIKFTS